MQKKTKWTKQIQFDPKNTHFLQNALKSNSAEINRRGNEKQCEVTAEKQEHNCSNWGKMQKTLGEIKTFPGKTTGVIQ